MLRGLKDGLRALFGRERRNAEIGEELGGFFDASVEDKVRHGMSREDAVRAARAEVGSAETVRHKVWAAGWESGVDSLWQDFRFGLRQILKSPGVSTVAILSLALGIGANTAIFTLINDLLMKQLPVRDPQMLVSFGSGDSGGEMEMSDPGPYDIFAYEFYRHIATQHDSPFAGVTAFGSFPTMVSVRKGSSTDSGAPATQAIGHLVSGTFFPVLGADAMLGRTLTPEDATAEGSNPVAVISYRYWMTAMAADPAVIGRTLVVNGTPFSIVGVMPEQFYGVSLNEDTPDMWLPITMQPQVMQQPTLLKPDGLFWVHMMARRKPDVPLSQAQAWLTTQFQQFLTERAGSDINANRRKEIAGSFIPLMRGEYGLSHIRSQYRIPLAVLMGFVMVVLLIACANLANLLLAKAVSREREFSTRLALGSSRARIVRQILVETLTLSFIGGALGLALAFAGTRLLIGFVSGGSTNTALSAMPDLHVLAFASAVCLLTGLLFGIAPAWRGSHSDIGNALTTRTGTAATGRRGQMLPKTLIVAQITLSLILIAVAGLLLRTLHNLRAQDLGFNRANVLLLQTNPKFAGYKPEQLNGLYSQIMTRMDALPGVRSTAISDGPPMYHGAWNSPIFIDGRPPSPNDDDPVVLLSRVSADYFETLGIPLLRGRTIRASDTASSVKAVVVNQTLANKYFPHGDALGHVFKVADPGTGSAAWQIVGIVGDTKHFSPADNPQPTAYLALSQLTGDDQYAYCIQVLTTGDPAKMTHEVNAALANVDANLPVLKTLTLAEHVDTLIDQQKFISQLAGFFALLALVLACIGLYGVMTYNVARRTNEIGVRMALGAARTEVLWMVLRESLLLLAAGVLLGVPAALGIGRLIRAGLFGVGPSDIVTLAASVLVIAAVVVGAAILPARRATQIDPMVALRYE